MPPASLALVILLTLATAFGGAFAMNEWSHGGVSEAFGLGHHHLLDWGGAPCGHHDKEHDAGHHADAHANGSAHHESGDCGVPPHARSSGPHGHGAGADG